MIELLQYWRGHSIAHKIENKNLRNYSPMIHCPISAVTHFWNFWTPSVSREWLKLEVEI